MLRESRMKHNIPQQFEGTLQMLGQKGGIDYRLFFICISVQVAPHILHPVEDMPGFPFLRPLENKMLYEMSHPLLILRFITCSGIDGKTTIRHFRQSRFVDDTQAIRQCIFVILHCFLLPY